MQSTKSLQAMAMLAAVGSMQSNTYSIPVAHSTSKGRNTSPNTLRIQRPRFMTEDQKRWNAEVDRKNEEKRRAKMHLAST